jgi:hypothetical protein
VNLAAFTVTGATACTADDLVYSVSSGAEFISFDPDTRVISFETSDTAKLGTYTVTLTGTILNSEQGS